MANVFPNPGEPFGAFNPFPQDRPNRNWAPPPPEQPATFGPNVFNRARREAAAASAAAGSNPPFVPDPAPAGSIWRAGEGGSWRLYVNAAPMPRRAAAYAQDRPYAAFQDGAMAARARGQGQGPAPAPPVVVLGRHGVAGTARPPAVPPLISLRDWIQAQWRTVMAGLVGGATAVWQAMRELAGPLLRLLTLWMVVIAVLGLVVQFSTPILERIAVAVLETLLEAAESVFGLETRWLRGNAAQYTLRPEYTSRAVTGIPFRGKMEATSGSVTDHITRGSPVSRSALSSVTAYLPFPLSWILNMTIPSALLTLAAGPVLDPDVDFQDNLFMEPT